MVWIFAALVGLAYLTLLAIHGRMIRIDETLRNIESLISPDDETVVEFKRRPR